ncbi:MAG: type I-E CRISPR-associated protein Cas6/Cse3/CasE, partial [Eubacteriaceae bacterium]|nr:type I-E CRISPR-associated protein Cas6/Cse3/CasE [Eubacteriaceae bacterium]
MYLSRVSLDRSDFHARLCLGDSNQMHRSLTRFFEASRLEAGLLYRLNSNGPENTVYMLSKISPIVNERSLGDMPKGMKLEFYKEISSYIESFNIGRVFSFDLLALPTKKVAEEGRKNSKRKFLTTREEREDWLNRKAEAGGFETLYS